MDTREHRAAVYNVCHVSRTDRIEYLFTALAQFLPYPRLDTVIIQILSRQCRRLDIKAHIVEPLYERHPFDLVLIRK